MKIICNNWMGQYPLKIPKDQVLSTRKFYLSITYLQHLMAQDVHSYCRIRSIVRKIWIKEWPKTSWANSSLWISMSNVKALFRSAAPFRSVDWNTLLSIGLIPHPVSSFLWKISHSSGFCIILRSPRVQLHSFKQWPL